ncbi:dependent protein kinase regulatory subunit [Seminavis robusta]|uniref:Dependent protein kinase regulatory subunit n=1 Tax=Seminavis robusta TaxID=568900 RepID=A0A9N8DDF8_9STRA|nr:dependent protein kinase regulatory subunit [Seminavis robusta]|eukprot:Sro43_g026180.1 dependent protein kinase regulatory subunit (610) ;mRNA; r:74523-76722
MTPTSFVLLLSIYWLSSLTSAFGTQFTPSGAAGQRDHAAFSRLFRRQPTAIKSDQTTSNDDLVSGESMAVSIAAGGGYLPESIPQFPKSTEEYKFIKKSLLQNVMFTRLPAATLDTLILAFEKRTANKEDIIVTQGEPCEGDFVYLVAEGDCTVIVDGKVVPEPYGTLKPKAIFGELGVLYNQTRAATICAKSDSVTLFRVNGATFKDILNHYFSRDDPETLYLIDQAIDQVSGTKSLYGGDIIRQYQSSRFWLWKKWTGTVFQHNWRTVTFNMAMSLLFIVLVRRCTDPTWKIGLTPDHSHPFIQRLDIIRKIWGYQMSLTTFILTFFLNQGFWMEVYGIARGIQGRLNDFHLLLATAARRNADGTLTTESERLIDDVSAYSRLFHILFWASCARRFAVLRTNRGMERMASRGLMTSRQLEILENLDVPDNQRHNACLEWMMIRAWKGIDDGTLRSEPSLSQRLMDQTCRLRATYATTGDKLSCRMPLPYTHLVQILVDSFIALSPVALYTEMGAYSIFSVGVLTLFYTGLLDLAKVFLDPLDNEDFTKNSIDMDLGVLIRESNGGSTRWKNCGVSLPFAMPPRPPPPPKPASATSNEPETEKEIKTD